MKNRLIGCATIAAAIAPTATFAAPSEHLNVIVILTDDVGYGDVSYTGNADVQTPAMQQLYSESICFDNFHTGTTSAPSRSGLMTGIDGNRTGVWHTIAGRSLLDLDLYTMGELFKDNGYATAMYGKWHLGDNYPYRPCDRGFDDVLCLKGGGIGQLPDYWGNTYFDDTYYRDRDIPEPQTGYCTDVFVGETERFVTENRDKPFFVYLALNAAHSPFNVEAKYSDIYSDKFDDRISRIYGMITNIDDNLASLRETLKEQGLDKNTVIILLGDNGSNVPITDKNGLYDEEATFNGGLRGKKSTVWEGGHRQAMLMHIPDHQASGTIDEQISMCYDLMPTLANLCDLTPSRDVRFDGVDILATESRAGRIAVVDTQRQEFLRVDATSAVMMDDWRLINRKQLYNLASDRAQVVDVAESNPEIVERLKSAHDEWWSYVAEDEDVRHPIYLSTDVKGESVVFNSHDLHTLNGKMPVWNQDAARRSVNTDGFWAVYAPKSGKYDFDLYRWNPTTGLNLDEAAPKGRVIPNNGKVAPKGVAITNMKSAAIYVDGVEVATCSDFRTDQPSVSLRGVKIKRGYHELRVEITNSEGESYPVWFVRSLKQ